MMALKVDEKIESGASWQMKAFLTITNRPDPRMKNKDVKATVYRLKMAGGRCCTDDYYCEALFTQASGIRAAAGSAGLGTSNRSIQSWQS